MADQSDRVVIKYGPARLDTDKAIQREIDSLRNEVETKTSVPAGDYTTPTDVEDIVNDIIDNYPPVAGGGGFVIGLPPGTPLAYAPLNLVNYPIDLDVVGPGIDFYSNVPLTGCRLSRDRQNVLGYGVDTILAYDRDGTSLAAFSPSSGLVTTVDFPSESSTYVSGFFSIDGYIVSYSDLSSSSPIIYTYDGSTVSSFTPTRSGYALRAIGPSSGYGRIIIVWANIYSPYDIIIDQYFGDGTLDGFTTNSTGGSQVQRGKVENGWIALPSVAIPGFFMRPASVATETLKALSSVNPYEDNLLHSMSIISSGKLVTQSVSDGQADLVICDYDSGSSTVFPGAIYNPYDTGDRPFFIGFRSNGSFFQFFPIASSIAAIDENSFVITGGTKTFDGVNYYDIPVSLYITLIDDPDNPGSTIFTNAYISHDTFVVSTGTIFDRTGYNNIAKAAITLSDGSVVYVIGDDYGSTPFCVMFNVKAEDYVP